MIQRSFTLALLLFCLLADAQAVLDQRDQLQLAAVATVLVARVSPFS
jgi:hypothetical protein